MKITELVEKLKDIHSREGEIDVKYSGEAGSDENVYFVDVEKSYDVDGESHKYVLIS